MKNLIRELVFGKSSLASGVVALGVVASIVIGCSCGKVFEQMKAAKEANLGNSNLAMPANDASDDSLPTESAVEGLVKETTARFAEAIDSNDFSALYSDASSDFRSTY
ncbi:MAG: hypothetical protein ABIV21_01610, partial [Pyrinomonadaceae bacterium]